MYRISLPITTYTQQHDLEREYLNSLQQRRVDVKFSYIGKHQANAWFNLCNSLEYTFYRNSLDILENSVKSFVANHKGDVNVIALGPGDAMKEKIVVDSLLEKYQVNLFFVDISREILNVAIKNTDDRDVLKEIFIADLMNFMHIKHLSRYVKSQYHATNFFTLLGNTLANYPQAMILKTLRNAMSPGDKILIDANIKSAKNTEEEAEEVDEMLKKYDNPYTRQLILASLSEARIEETDGTIEIEFGRDDFFPQMGAIKSFFCFDRSKVITYQDEDIYFAKGERILTHYSNNYTLESLESILISHGLNIIKHIKSADGKYYQLLCELA